MGDSTGNGEDVLSMVDVLEEDNALQEEANAVLGACDDENCTYSSVRRLIEYWHGWGLIQDALQIRQFWYTVLIWLSRVVIILSKCSIKALARLQFRG